MSEPLPMTAAPPVPRPPVGDPTSAVRLVEAESRPYPLRAGGLIRSGCFGIAAGCLFVLYTAGRLSPDPSGMGTHRQLGLAGCGFHQATGVPCMSCGMTTAFAHTARGELLSAVAAQPMGAALALACVAAVVPAMWTALTGHVWLPLFILLTSQRFWFSVLGAWMASWVYKAVAARLSAG